MHIYFPNTSFSLCQTQTQLLLLPTTDSLTRWGPAPLWAERRHFTFEAHEMGKGVSEDARADRGSDRSKVSLHLLWKQTDGSIITKPSRCVNLCRLTKGNLSGDEFKHPFPLQSEEEGFDVSKRTRVGSVHDDKSCWFGRHLSPVSVSTPTGKKTLRCVCVCPECWLSKDKQEIRAANEDKAAAISGEQTRESAESKLMPEREEGRTRKAGDHI